MDLVTFRRSQAVCRCSLAVETCWPIVETKAIPAPVHAASYARHTLPIRLAFGAPHQGSGFLRRLSLSNIELM